MVLNFPQSLPQIAAVHAWRDILITGEGMPQDFDYHKSGVLGLQLVNSPVARLDERPEFDQSAGPDFKVSFKY
jgi:two-component sensor histidine kinase